MIRLFPGLVRIPDVAFVVRESDTAKEMERRQSEYFESGAQLLWIVDPKTRTVTVHGDRGQPTILTEADMLDGGVVLPGFKLEVRTLFADPLA